MRDPVTFEARLAAAFERYADTAPIEVDARAVAAAVARGQERTRAGGRGALVRSLRRPGPLVRLLLVAAILAALVGATLVVGSQRRLPPPFGLAANGLIAFDLGGDVYAGDPATGRTHLVLGGPAQESAPAFSPDGTRIALIQSTSDPFRDRVVVVGVDGTDPIVVTPDPLLDLTWVDWTPDSRSIALVALVGTRTAFLLADAKGGGVRTIVDTMDVDVPEFRPPDGRQVMFRASTADGVGIYVIDADGSDLHPLIPLTPTGNLQYDLRGPQYSPDGTKIAYMAWDDGLGQMRTWIMNADGTGKRQLPHDPQAWFEGWPRWSPDGQRLVLIRQFYGSDGQPLDNTRPFAVAWVDGHAPTIETGPPMTTGMEHAQWSPDGTKLLVQGNDRQLILDPAGGPGQTLPWDSNAYPAWQRLAP